MFEALLLQGPRYDPTVYFWLSVVGFPVLWLLTSLVYLFVRRTSVRYYAAHGVSERTALATFFVAAGGSAVLVLALTGVPAEPLPHVVMAVTLFHGVPIILTALVLNVALLARLYAADATGAESTGRVLQSGVVRAGDATLSHPETEAPVVFYDADLAIRRASTGRESVPFLLDLGETAVRTDAADSALLVFDRHYGTGAFAFPQGVTTIGPGDDLTLLGSLRPVADGAASHALDPSKWSLLADRDPRALRRKLLRRIGANAVGVVLLLGPCVELLSI